MPVNRLRAFLDEHHVRYVTMGHSPAYTAQEIAAATHIPGRALAKTVMVKVDGRMTMVVLPAADKIDLRLLKKMLGASKAELATEAEFKESFPDCEIGAMPPAGTHTEVMKLDFAAFERLVEPTVLKLSMPA